MPLTYEPPPTTTIMHACRVAALMARKQQREVAFRFNGFDLLATPETTATELANRYWQHLHQQAVLRTPDSLAKLGVQQSP